jgi:phospholipase C
VKIVNTLDTQRRAREAAGGLAARPISRRAFLKGAGGAGVALLGGTLWRTAPAAAQARRVQKVDTPIEYLVIACQENHSFDEYYGYAPQVQALGYGPPAGYFQPDSSGGKHYPFEETSTSTPDPPHSWTAVHQQWDAGAMDGFWQTAQTDIGDGDVAIGYYTARELPYYYSLFESSAGLCANYHSSLLGPTWPNRFYFASGTSGGITTNGIWGYGIFDDSRWPIILDLLDQAGVSWRIYNMNFDSVPHGNTDNVFVFWKNFAHDQRTLGSKGSFLNDARRGTLPQVSWLVSSFAHHKDEHPPADVTIGMDLQQELITAVQQSPIADSTVYLLTYDEHGGFFDHVTPPVADAYGLGVRVPLWVISRYAKRGPVQSSLPAEHTSTLKLIEALHGLPTLASINHTFDTSTPTGSNYQADGAPAPPRDGRDDISDLLDLFSFS